MFVIIANWLCWALARLLTRSLPAPHYEGRSLLLSRLSFWARWTSHFPASQSLYDSANFKLREFVFMTIYFWYIHRIPNYIRSLFVSWLVLPATDRRRTKSTFLSSHIMICTVSSFSARIHKRIYLVKIPKKSASQIVTGLLCVLITQCDQRRKHLPFLSGSN